MSRYRLCMPEAVQYLDVIDAHAPDPVGRAENGGRTLEEAGIVHSMSVLNAWSGKPVRLQVPYPVGQDVAVLLQRDDGHIVGAAVARAPSGSS